MWVHGACVPGLAGHEGQAGDLAKQPVNALPHIWSYISKRWLM